MKAKPLPSTFLSYNIPESCFSVWLGFSLALTLSYPKSRFQPTLLFGFVLQNDFEQKKSLFCDFFHFDRLSNNSYLLWGYPTWFCPHFLSLSPLPLPVAGSNCLMPVCSISCTDCPAGFVGTLPNSPCRLTHSLGSVSPSGRLPPPFPGLWVPFSVLFQIINSSSFKVVLKSETVWPMPFTPSPSQEFHRYYGIDRLPVFPRYFDPMGTSYLCLFACHQNRDLPCFA